MTDFKMVGALRITDNTSIWITEDDGVPRSPPDEVPLTAGLYYISGDGTATDLLFHLTDELINVGGVSASIGVNSSGIVELENGGDPFTISWALPGGETGGASEYVQAWLRLESYGDEYEIPETTHTGARTHVYGYYPAQYLQMDLEEYLPRANQLVPDSGNGQIVKVARRKQYRIKVRSVGYPRSNTFNEYHALEDWHGQATSGRPFRLYSDTTVTAAYSTTARYGYQLMQIVPEPFVPAPLSGNWYKYMEHEFTAHEYT